MMVINEIDHFSGITVRIGQGLFSLTRIDLFACVHPLLSWHCCYEYEMRLVPLIAAAFSG